MRPLRTPPNASPEPAISAKAARSAASRPVSPTAAAVADPIRNEPTVKPPTCPSPYSATASAAAQTARLHGVRKPSGTSASPIPQASRTARSAPGIAAENASAESSPP